METVDLRDIIEQKNPEEYKRWATAIKDQTGVTIEELAENEPTMIPAVDFVEYAQELAEDIGAISKDNQWPNYCIDWEWAARELQHDYSEIEVDSMTYYYRSY